MVREARIHLEIVFILTPAKYVLLKEGSMRKLIPLPHGQPLKQVASLIYYMNITSDNISCRVFKQSEYSDTILFNHDILEFVRKMRGRGMN